jgi:hypothetical protein
VGGRLLRSGRGEADPGERRGHRPEPEITKVELATAPPATSPSCGQQPLHHPGGPSRSRCALSQLLRSGRGEADPVPESGAATAPNRKSLKWNRRRRRRRPHHRAASSRCAAQAARAGRADSAPPKASFAAPDSSAPTRQGIKSASAPAEKSGERASASLAISRKLSQNSCLFVFHHLRAQLANAQVSAQQTTGRHYTGDQETQHETRLTDRAS